MHWKSAMFVIMAAATVLPLVLGSCGLDDPKEGDSCDYSVMNPYCRDDQTLLFCDDWSGRVVARECPSYCLATFGSEEGFCKSGYCVCP